jgi:hypothetical protein
MRITLAFFLCTFLIMPAFTPTASGEDAQTQNLIEQLRARIDKAEGDRDADPRFLGDLRAILAGYDRPWRTPLIQDDFRDGDFSHNPSWSVAEGKFYIDYSGGLRNRITPAPAPAPSASEPKKSEEDVAQAILGGFLDQVTGTKEQQQEPTAPPPAAERAEIYLARTITNAFALKLSLASLVSPGRLEFGVYQGGDRETGYRLVYNPGGVPAIELVRTSSRGSSVIELYDEPLALEDNNDHVVEWTRHPGGEMAVSIDDRELFKVLDRAFKDPFHGFTIINTGGDFSIGEIALYGTN